MTEAIPPPPNVEYELLPFEKDFHKGLDVLPHDTVIAITATNAFGDDSLDVTLDRAEEAIGRGFNYVVPHVAARMIHSREHLAEIKGRTEALGIVEIFFPGGDVDYSESLAYPDVLRLFEEMATQGWSLDYAGFAAYPRGHHNPLVNEKLAADLRAKVEIAPHIARKSKVKTQFDFDPEAVVSWMQTMSQLYPDVPMQIGLLGAVGPKKAMRALVLNGGIAKAKGFMNKTGLTERSMLTGAYKRQTLDVAQAVAVAVQQQQLSFSGFTINTLNDVQGTLDAFQTVHELALELQEAGQNNQDEPFDEHTPHLD